jgi:hypothetical protein
MGLKTGPKAPARSLGVMELSTRLTNHRRDIGSRHRLPAEYRPVRREDAASYI